MTKRRHRACDEEFCACTHADVRARHLVIAELSLPPRRSISSIVAFSGATSLATRVIFLVTRFRANERRSRDAFPPVSARASGPTQPRDPSQRDIASRRRSTRARHPVGPGSSRARPCSPRRRSIVATRDPIAQSEKGRKYPREISRWANRPSKRRFGFVFFWFGVGLPNNGRGHLTKRAPRISDLRVRVSSSSFHRTPIARTQGLPPPPP